MFFIFFIKNIKHVFIIYALLVSNANRLVYKVLAGVLRTKSGKLSNLRNQSHITWL